MTDPIVRPWNLLWLVPIVMVSMLFEDPMNSLGFALTMSFVTSRMFPLIDFKEEEKE